MKNLCAVKGCTNRGKPQICPYDGRYHGHGRIHYDCGCPEHNLEFRTGDWYFICDEHYQIVSQERSEWVSNRQLED